MSSIMSCMQQGRGPPTRQAAERGATRHRQTTDGLKLAAAVGNRVLIYSTADGDLLSSLKGAWGRTAGEGGGGVRRGRTKRGSACVVLAGHQLTRTW